MATKEQMQELLDAMVSHSMERNKDAIIDAFWRGGGTLVTFEEDGIVVRPLAPEEMYKMPQDGG